LAVIRARAPRNGAALEGLPGIARRLLRGEFDPASYRPHPADDSMLAYSCAQNRTIVRLAACGALPRSSTGLLAKRNNSHLMPPRRSSKKDSPKKLAGRMKRRWRVVLLRSKGEILSQVEAPDAEAAKAPAAVQFDLDEVQRNRIMVQELG